MAERNTGLCTPAAANQFNYYFMSTLHREYHKLPNGQEIKFIVTFNKDRYNWATSQVKKIGYQVSATPVKRTDDGGGFIMEEFGAFTGFNDNLLEVDRQSAKRLQTAIKILQGRKEKYLKYFDPEDVKEATAQVEADLLNG